MFKYNPFCDLSTTGAFAIAKYQVNYLGNRQYGTIIRVGFDTGIWAKQDAVSIKWEKEATGYFEVRTEAWTFGGQFRGGETERL